MRSPRPSGAEEICAPEIPVVCAHPGRYLLRGRGLKAAIRAALMQSLVPAGLRLRVTSGEGTGDDVAGRLRDIRSWPSRGNNSYTPRRQAGPRIGQAFSTARRAKP